MVEARKTTKQNTVAKNTSSTPGAPKQGAAAAKGGTTPLAKNGQRVLGAGRDNYECPVCLELCAQPVLTPCKHFMCFQCNKRVVAAGMTCPMCRAHFDKLFVPQVDKTLQE